MSTLKQLLARSSRLAANDNASEPPALPAEPAEPVPPAGTGAPADRRKPAAHGARQVHRPAPPGAPRTHRALRPRRRS